MLAYTLGWHSLHYVASVAHSSQIGAVLSQNGGVRLPQHVCNLFFCGGGIESWDCCVAVTCLVHYVAQAGITWGKSPTALAGVWVCFKGIWYHVVFFFLNYIMISPNGQSFLLWSRECVLVSQLCQTSALMWLRLHLTTVKNYRSSCVQLCAMAS